MRAVFCNQGWLRWITLWKKQSWDLTYCSICKTGPAYGAWWSWREISTTTIQGNTTMSAVNRDITLATANMECWKTLAAIHIWVLGFWLPVRVWEETLPEKTEECDRYVNILQDRLQEWCCIADPHFLLLTFTPRSAFVSSSLLAWNGQLQNWTPKTSNLQSQPRTKMGSFRADERQNM